MEVLNKGNQKIKGYPISFSFNEGEKVKVLSYGKEITEMEDEDDYYFDYIVKVNGEMKLSDSYSGDCDGGDIEEIKKSLENGMAEDLILEDFGHDLFNY